MAATVIIQRATFVKPFKLIDIKSWVNTCGSAVRVISRSLSSGDASDQWKNVLDYWFSPGADKKWFHGGQQVDEELRQKFGSLVSEIIGEMKEWELEPKPSLALVLLTDQFTRSIYRNTAKAFAGDARARVIARKFLEGKTHNHLDLSYAERIFIYLPFEHSEDKGDQELSLSLMSKLVEDFKGTDHAENAQAVLEFATRHKEVIDRFGRYPQRNKPLGRENTPEEEEFLNNTPDQYKW